MSAFVCARIDEIGRAEWNRLGADDLEDWSYYRAVERCGLPGFSWRYFGVREGGELRAAMPAFVTDYRLDTTLQGSLRRAAEALTGRFPRLLRIPLLSFGSPVTEHCSVGFAPSASARDRRRWLDAILAEAEALAQREGCRMIAVKDAPADRVDWEEAYRAHRLRPMPGLPGALLALPHASVDDYLASLSPATRKDLRRKRRAAESLRIEWRLQIDDVIDRVMDLYRQTLARAPLTFEELTPQYFLAVLDECAGRAHCVLYWEGDALVAFNLVLAGRDRLLDKFFGMDGDAGRRLNLYYVSWLENVRYAIAHGLRVYESGQGLHAEKQRLGSRLAVNRLWYRHRNRAVDAVFALVERAFRLDDEPRHTAVESRA